MPFGRLINVKENNMLDDIIKELKGSIGKDVQQRSGLDPQKADRAIEMAGQSAKEVAEDEVRKGNLQGLMGLMNQKEGAGHENPIVGKIGANLVGKLVSGLGLTPEVAKQVEGVVVPLMVSFISNKFQNSKGGGMGGLGGLLGGSGGLGGMLGGFFK
ncbi:hypothetical protein D770_26675 [Flammeovirgaceae bacterium 311]|nr:hypothetical protein D770_26675 [Flammeovirgaceae bacterium 311]